MEAAQDSLAATFRHGSTQQSPVGRRMLGPIDHAWEADGPSLNAPKHSLASSRVQPYNA